MEQEHRALQLAVGRRESGVEGVGAGAGRCEVSDTHVVGPGCEAAGDEKIAVGTAVVVVLVQLDPIAVEQIAVGVGRAGREEGQLPRRTDLDAEIVVVTRLLDRPDCVAVHTDRSGLGSGVAVVVLTNHETCDLGMGAGDVCSVTKD